MKKLIFILLLILSGNAGAADLDTLVKEAEALSQWNINCKDDNCFLQVATRYNKGPTGAMEQVGLGVSYNIKNKDVDHISFFLPVGIDSKKDLLIRFVKTVPNGNSFKLVPANDGFIDLPINDSNDKFCASRVDPQIKDEHENNSDINLIEKLKTSEHVWLMFYRNGKPETAMIPVYKFKDEFSKMINKEESNIGVQGTGPEPPRP